METKNSKVCCTGSKIEMADMDKVSPITGSRGGLVFRMDAIYCDGSMISEKELLFILFTYSSPHFL